jgi:glucose-6-phosphate isomerase
MMIDLSQVSGLPIKLNKDCTLTFGRGLPVVEPAVRTGKQMKPVLLAANAVADKEILYYMYRDICLPEQRELFTKYRVRYDITILKPGKIGDEFIKTFGHYHPKKPGTSVTYGELYQVLYGTAGFLLQENGKKPQEIIDVIFIEADPGAVITIPPGYGHITVNIGSEPLVVANLVCPDFKSDYVTYVKFGGGAVYISSTVEGIEFINNNNYLSIPQLRHSKVFVKEQGIYQRFFTQPQEMRFLVEPEWYEAKALLGS